VYECTYRRLLGAAETRVCQSRAGSDRAGAELWPIPVETLVAMAVTDVLASTLFVALGMAFA